MKTKKFTNSFSPHCMAILFAILCAIPLKAGQTHHTEDYARHIVGVLKGIYFDYSKEEAVTILHEIAEQDSMPYAMNALGLIYIKGTGVKKNMKEGLHWLEEAGKHGMADAYHDIGAVYKEGRSGIKQDLVKAYVTFLEGARLGSRKCTYDAGYMLYKGLGCEQSYAKSMEMFEIAAQRGHSGAMYMLGLCYRNGYGTEQNEEKGLELLNKAAVRGFKTARDELTRSHPENFLHYTLASDDDSVTIPLSMPEICTGINDTSLLNGDYTGYLIVYDWSGKFILREKPIRMSVKRTGSEASGNIYVEDYDIPFRADVQDDGTLKFKDSYAKLKERYTKNGKVNYRLDYAKLDIWKDSVRGELSLFSQSHREPEKPMYIQLKKLNSSNATTSDSNHISVSPNPFSSVIKVAIELETSCNVTTRIFDKYGIVAYQQDMGHVEKGKQEFVMSPKLEKGYYILNITAGKHVLRTVIIKE